MQFMRGAAREHLGDTLLTVDFLVIYREVPGVRIPGGSEDVMLDLAVRQLVKLYRAKTNALGSSKI